MKHILSILLAAALLLSAAAFAEAIDDDMLPPFTYIELEDDFIYAPNEPAPHAVILTRRGMWMHTEHDKSAAKMVLIPPQTEIKMLAEYENGWWRVSAWLGDTRYTGYCWLENRMRGRSWKYTTDEDDDREPSKPHRR